jgi:mannose-6-phosphate isomerase
MTTKGLIPLKGYIQHYAWGGYDYLPTLLDLENEEQKPFAELWMGVHHRGPATAQIGAEEKLLSDLLAEHPEWLGEKGRLFNALPFLFKILDVRAMLSIQSHPKKEQAEAGFKAENEAGIPVDAFNRNFKDDNHKPEVMVALTDFWLLHGFKSNDEILEVLDTIEGFTPLKVIFENSGTYGLYKHIMELPQNEVDEILTPLHEKLSHHHYNKNQAEYWALNAFENHTLEGGHIDRGIFSIFLFNLVHLKVGEGIYQGAGIPHAYLEGVNVELMANSDNVFRGGLTVKHIDVPMLLNHLVFDPVTPNVLKGEPISDSEWSYPTPAPDFDLSRIELEPGKRYVQKNINTAHILIVISGEGKTSEGYQLSQGKIFFAPAGADYEFTAQEKLLLFKAK